MPGGFFVLHTAYGRIGSMDVGGTEILGYDTTTKKYFSHLYDSGGNFHEAELEAQDNIWTWKGKAAGCTSVFTENGKVQTAHHVEIISRLYSFRIGSKSFYVISIYNAIWVN